MRPLEQCPEPLHSVVACPNRSATPLQLVVVVAGLAMLCGAVCGLSFLQGNLLAPLFGVLDVVLVGVCLRWVWRTTDQSDAVSWSGGAIEVCLRRGKRRWLYRFHPCWVRLVRESDHRVAAGVRLFIGSHGRRLELGRFLGAAQRAAFANDVARLLQAARVG